MGLCEEEGRERLPEQFTRRIHFFPGFVYLAHGAKDDLYKIGSTNNVKKRLYGLRSEYGRQFGEIEIIHSIPTTHKYRLESELRKRFESLNINDDLREFGSSERKVYIPIDPQEWLALDDANVGYIKSLERVDYPPEYETLTVGQAVIYESPHSRWRTRVEIKAFQENRVLVQEIGYRKQCIGKGFWVEEQRIEVCRRTSAK